jgi:hypothetical protein
MIGEGRHGTDDRLFQTSDVTATILDYFEVPPLDAQTGDSFLSTGGRSVTRHVTEDSDRHNEWFLILVTDSRKYVANIHPQGDGSTEILAREGYADRSLGRTVGPPPEVADALREALAELSIPSDAVHVLYR